LSYAAGIGGVAPESPPAPRLTAASNALYSLDHALLVPIGSGAPEEMFYRGFLQNEMYHLVPSPFFSIPASTLAFTFSHGPADRISAAVLGAYAGFLAHKYGGKLGPGIALHFWVDLLIGLCQVAVLHNAQGIPFFNFSTTF
jgi:membrane protease YdiL (CAAX protease family)